MRFRYRQAVVAATITIIGVANVTLLYAGSFGSWENWLGADKSIYCDANVTAGGAIGWSLDCDLNVEWGIDGGCESCGGR